MAKEWVDYPFAPSGSSEGTLLYVDAQGRLTALAIPGDWAAREAAGTPYVLGIIDGVPAWVVTAASAVDGFGAGFGDAFGQD